MGCDQDRIEDTWSSRVSIHAPAWGATLMLCHFYNDIQVSIHAPAWGATISHSFISSPRSVSIHAPAWGATQYRPELAENPLFQSTHPHGVRLDSLINSRDFSSFNPRTRMGCDPRSLTSDASLHKFQSTHPHGVRLFLRSASVFAVKFQSTHPHGVRRMVTDTSR